MATNPKYQRAPQRDSLDEQSYTQPPPSYTDAGPSDGLLGAPRSEDDNVPDDFKVSDFLSLVPTIYEEPVTDP